MLGIPTVGIRTSCVSYSLMEEIKLSVISLSLLYWPGPHLCKYSLRACHASCTTIGPLCYPKYREMRFNGRLTTFNVFSVGSIPASRVVGG